MDTDESVSVHVIQNDETDKRQVLHTIESTVGMMRQIEANTMYN